MGWKYRYEYQTIKTGVDLETDPVAPGEIAMGPPTIVEVVNMLPDREQFRALVRVDWWESEEESFSSPVGDGIHFEDVPMKWSDEAIAAMDAEPGVFGQEEE